MLFQRRKYGIPFAEVWFALPEGFRPNRYIVCNYHEMPEPIAVEKGMRLIKKRAAQTLVSDLTVDEADILSRCAANVRNEIRRAQREGVCCARLPSHQITSKTIADFNAAYVDMYRQKGIDMAPVTARVSQLTSVNALLLTMAKMEEETVAYHVYVTGDGVARLLYSVSAFRGNADGALRSAIGRANRLLHYEDMLYLKRQGYDTYDWGGLASDPSLESINAFKRGFGGEPAPRYNAAVTHHWLVYTLYSLLNEKGAHTS